MLRLRFPLAISIALSSLLTKQIVITAGQNTSGSLVFCPVPPVYCLLLNTVREAIIVMPYAKMATLYRRHRYRQKER